MSYSSLAGGSTPTGPAGAIPLPASTSARSVSGPTMPVAGRPPLV
ncbi:MAG: hypothetical protein ACMUHX_06400 [bacterium]